MEGDIVMRSRRRVVAIAVGLIALVVFFAVPLMRRTSRAPLQGPSL